MKLPDGGPAFPRTVENWNGNLSTEAEGMSLRDWFAGQALTGLLASYTDGPLAPDQAGDCDDFAKAHGHDSVADQTAFQAYAYADAMLRARALSEPVGEPE